MNAIFEFGVVENPRSTKFQANLEKSKKLQILAQCNFFVNRDTSMFDMRNKLAERPSIIVTEKVFSHRTTSMYSFSKFSKILILAKNDKV